MTQYRKLEQKVQRLREELERLQDVVCEQEAELIEAVLEETAA